MKLFSTQFAGLLLLGVASAAVSAEPIPADLMGKFEEVLSDPLGAQIFLRPADSASQAAQLVCGKFNAKNGHGAFVGFKPFAFKRDLGVLYYDGVVVHKDGTVDSVWELIQNTDPTPEEFQSISQKSRKIMSEVESALALCASR